MSGPIIVVTQADIVRWHDRSDSCIEEQWETAAPTGTLPDPWTSCPGEWFWHKVSLLGSAN